ncbi:hypothetical protein D6783_00410 [Candidatus Woesearchaeota archaeon]|nr:MAG: hypothetical protein D6783_00410 [Candidatus Woesearchaeota archaeon]
MLKRKDLLVLSQLRRNARIPLTKMSKETNIPVSTIFDTLRSFEQNIIKRHTVLMDFRRVGFDLRVHILFKLPRAERESFEKFLLSSPRVNSVFRVSNGFDYAVEGIFRDMRDLHAFSESLDRFDLEKKEEFFIVEDLKQEGFLTDELFLDVIDRTSSVEWAGRKRRRPSSSERQSLSVAAFVKNPS